MRYALLLPLTLAACAANAQPEQPPPHAIDPVPIGSPDLGLRGDIAMPSDNIITVIVQGRAPIKARRLPDGSIKILPADQQ